MNASLFSLSAAALVAVASTTASADLVTVLDFEDGTTAGFGDDAQLTNPTVVAPGLGGSDFAYQSTLVDNGSNRFDFIGVLELTDLYADGFSFDAANPTVEFDVRYEGQRVNYSGVRVAVNVFEEFGNPDGSNRNEFTTVAGQQGISAADAAAGTELTAAFDLSSVLSSLNDADADSVTLRLIANTGAGNAGTYTIDNVRLNGSFAVVPEPASLALLGLGGLALLGRRR